MRRRHTVSVRRLALLGQRRLRGVRGWHLCVVAFIALLLWFGNGDGDPTAIDHPSLIQSPFVALQRSATPRGLSVCELEGLRAALPATTAAVDTVERRPSDGVVKFSGRLTMADVSLLTNYTLFDAAATLLGNRTRLVQFFSDDRVMCALALLYLRNCDEDADSVFGCARRLGSRHLRLLTPMKCSVTHVFESLARAVDKVDAACGVPAARPRSPAALALGEVEQTQLVYLGAPAAAPLRALLAARGSRTMQRALDGEPFLPAEEKAVRSAFYVPPAQRPPFRMPPSLHCWKCGRRGTGFTVHPFAFAMTARPANTTYPARKLFEFFPILPSRFASTKLAGDVVDMYMLKGHEKALHEWLYATLMRYSMFAFTHKRGGWDCLRNAEILHYGAVPVFVDLRASPLRTPSNIPRQELLAVLQEPMLSHLGHVSANAALYPRNPAKHRATTRKQFTYFLTRCNFFCNVDFRRMGWLYLDPYRAEHARDVAAGVASGPLSFRSPVIQRHYERIARPLWDLAGTYYSAASLMSYLLHTINYTEPRRVLVIGVSLFDTDYIHETVVTGLSDLGISAESLVRQEATKTKRISFVPLDGTSIGSNNSSSNSSSNDAVQAAMGDPREVGMVAAEEILLSRFPTFQSSFSTSGRWNPFVVRRVNGADRLDKASQRQSFKIDQVPLIKERLQDGEFDLVIYSVVPLYAETVGSRGLILSEEVRAALPRERIVFIDHNDIVDEFQAVMPRNFAPYGHVFVREVAHGCPLTYREGPASGE